MGVTPAPNATPAFDGTGNQVSPSVVNTYRINAVSERLATHLQLGTRCEPFELYHLCLSLSRGIDYALANGEIPDRAHDLPALMKQICQRKNDEHVQAAAMVLMISVKNACEIGWFGTKESQELITSAEEMGKIYRSMGNVNSGLSSCLSTVQTIMERFYPSMKLGRILASIEAKPGFGACPVDFHITKNTVQKEKIFLLVVQTDSIETSACLISPQHVNFLLNGKGVDRRTTVLMDTGPQMPTNVTSMLKFGTNLLQAVGQFNGHYVILLAYMSVTSLPEHPVLQDYVQPAATSVDSDSDIIEGHSQISLNCPISFTRIKTPVKGRSCKHFQCFDFDNYIDISSRRPHWRCPHCNQCVSYADIRLDRNMVEVLKDVGENVVEVIVHADGSWKAVLENDHKMQNKAHNFEKQQTEPQESTCSPSTINNVLDLTDDDDLMEEIMNNTFETADRKPFQASVHGQFVTPSSTSLGMNSVGVDQTQTEDDFWSGLYLAHARSDTPTVGVSEHPTPPDTVSPAVNQEVDGHDTNSAINSVMHNQFSSPNNMQMQLSYNSVVNEYGRSVSIPRHISRAPVAVQALPVQSQASRPQQNLRTYSNSLLPNSSTTTPQVPSSNPTPADGFNAILSDTERQQRFSRSPMNPPQVSGVNSSVLQHHSATQNRGPPFNTSAPSQLQNTYRAGLFSEFGNAHLQQAFNPRAVHPTRSSNTQQFHSPPGVTRTGVVQPAGATASSQARVLAAAQASRQSASISVQNPTDSFRRLTGDPRGNVGGPPQSVSRADDLINLQSEQNWRPTAPMRGSLAGRHIPDDVRQQIIMPTQPSQSPRPQVPQLFRQTHPIQSSRPQGTQPVKPTNPVHSSRPPGPQPVRPTGVSPQLDVLIAKNRSTDNNSSNT
ncbi:hypothetical protein RIF29_37469 [Crotalaria pallida]|uniref:SP-RING-type domain-containing protein n=1 Tax=Crotalaria pallida TaxID=3830 RepID=A0AAN9EEM5_CROPI